MIEISIVIPTRNRSELLRKCLMSLFLQNHPQENFEVLVCDDESNDGTVETVKNLIKAHQNLRYFRQKQKGPAAARNLGIKHAKGEIIAFTDDDCQPTRDWLRKIEKVFSKNSKTLGVEGKTLSDTKETNLLTCQLINESGGRWWTCNIAYKKSALKTVGGFDESFHFSHCEDIDLAQKVLKQGRIIFASEVLVVHPTRKVGIFSGLKKLSHLGDEFRLYQKHPGYFSQFSPLKNESAIFFLIAWGHIWYRARLLKGSLKSLFQNPWVWFQFLIKNLLELLFLILVFPKAVFEAKKRNSSP